MLGTAAGSVGDVTLMRRMGKQVSRLRVREVANPKTYGQARQRCYMAPIPKFYAPLAIALEKSWEGKNKSESYSAFLKKNAQLARINNWTLPKGTGFYPLPYRVSNGTLPSVNANFAINNSKKCLEINIGNNVSGSYTWGLTSRDIINGLGLQTNDQLTFIFVRKVDDGIFIPTYLRIYLDINSNQQMPSYLSNNGLEYVNSTDDKIRLSLVDLPDDIIAGCVIASRWENNMWRRSIESMSCAPEILAAINPVDDGAANIGTYMTSSDANPSDVYLNGSAE